ncbi:MAG: YqgE/AlgH family protein [Acetobacteraceae bacterium]
MPVTWLHPAALCLAALLWSGEASPVALQQPAAQPPQASMAGDLLVASSHIGDPRFWHTVILLVRQNDQGAMGVVVNRPLGAVPLARLLQALGLDDSGVKGTIRIFRGGPVSPAVIFDLHGASYHDSGTVAIPDGFALTVDPQILEAIAHGHGPKKNLVAFGYAGWAPGQLQMELARGDWFVIPATATLVFGEPRNRVWDDAMARRGIQL